MDKARASQEQLRLLRGGKPLLESADLEQSALREHQRAKRRQQRQAALEIKQEQRRAMLQAARLGHSGQLMKLIEEGANINWRDPRNGRTALMMLAEQDLASGVEKLLALKPALELRDKNGYTALHFAAAYEMVRGGFGYGDDVEIYNGQASIRALLRAGANPNAATKTNATPLMLAAATYGGGESVPMLIEAGADISRLDCSGLCAADYAKRQGFHWPALKLGSAAAAPKPGLRI